MSLKETILNVYRGLRELAAGEKQNPVGHLAVTDVNDGGPIARTSDPDAILRSIEVEPWAYVCINQIGKSLSSCPLIVERQQTVDAELEWVQMDSGPLVDLLAHPNNRESIDMLLWRLVMSLITGDGYLIYDRIDNELYHVHPKWVSVVPDKQTGEVLQYVITRGAETVTLEPEDVIDFSMPNPLHDYYGFSPLTPGKQQVLINYHYTRYLKTFFKNGAIPSGLLKSDQPLDTDTIKRYRAEWEKMHGGGTYSENHHRTAILGSGFTYQDISPPLRDLVIDSLWKMPRETLLALFGMPPVLAGIFEYANYANSKEQIKIFWENTIIPVQRIISSTLNVQLVSQFGEKLRIRFDNSNVAALQEDKSEQMKRLRGYVSGGILTPNEARQELGEEPIEGGDELRAGGGMFGMGDMGDNADSNGNNNDDNDDDNGGDGGKAVGQPSLRFYRASRTEDPRQFYQQEHQKRVVSYETGFATIVRRYFDGQLDRVIANLKNLSVGGQLNAALLRYYIHAAAKDADDDANEIFNLAAENAVLSEATAPFVRETVRKAGQRAVDQVGVAIDFRVDNPNVSTMIDLFHNRMNNINNTTYNEIKDVLRQAYDDGLGMPEVERLLRDKFKMFSKVRAKRIAATEMNGMVNGASVEGYKISGLEKQEWMSARLPTSRQWHVDADGSIVRVGDYFEVGGSMMKYPGDPNGLPEDTINCYCTVRPVVE